MQLKRLTPEILVAGQITPQDIAQIAAEGVRSIINNRPDGEEASQPSIASIEAAAGAAGISFASVPFTSGRQTLDDVRQFAGLLDTLDKPLLIYCRSGMRSSSIWAMAEAGRRPVDELLSAAAGAGYDLGPLRPTLEALAAQA